MDFIRIRGAREHNLKDISLDIPKNRIVVITGPSGSGKSSLAFDIIYREAYRRYIEAIALHKRWAMEQMGRPDVDIIEGLPPAICIKQWEASRNPRSTVGTITDIYDYLRLLFSKVGKPYCPNCSKEISFYSVQEMADQIMSLDAGKKVQLLAPIRESHPDLFLRLRRDGFIRVRVDGEIISLDEDINLSRENPSIEVIVDRLIIKDGIRKRLVDSIELALDISNGLLLVDVLQDKELFFSKRPICYECGFNLPDISPQLFSFNNPKGACPLCNGLGTYKGELCPECNGTRLKPISRHIKINEMSISELSSMPLEALYHFFEKLDLPEKEMVIAEKIIKEIKRRIGFIIEMDLGYISLDRAVTTLSGGEEQRIRLASQLSSNLSGILYIMDEPTIGLHPRDTEKLIASIISLRSVGNTLLIVEHDPDMVLSSDHVIEMGPGAGDKGGNIVFQGSPKGLLKADTITGRYVSGKRGIRLPKRRKRGAGRFLVIKGAREHNLKSIDVAIPLGTLTCITGVSGSGKSTLVGDIIYPALVNRLYKAQMKEGRYKEIKGVEHINRVVYVDQRPIARSPRSTPATYTGLFSHIRNLFSMLPDARVRGYKPSRFSFNVEGGGCEVCKGEGMIRVEMDFLPDLYIMCEACNGKRFNRDVLEIRYKGMNIADVLDMTAEQALLFFENMPVIRNKLAIFVDVGLGYIRLGQPVNTLSGGEAQRLKLIKELSKRGRGMTLYILDEPTIGLHQSDIEHLLNLLRRLVNMGNSVIIVEHNLDVIKSSDYIIDLGPEGGQEKGGYLVGSGTPEELARISHSHTGRFLRKIIAQVWQNPFSHQTTC